MFRHEYDKCDCGTKKNVKNSQCYSCSQVDDTPEPEVILMVPMSKKNVRRFAFWDNTVPKEVRRSCKEVLTTYRELKKEQEQT